MRIAITGAGGFIGSKVLEKLADYDEIDILDNYCLAVGIRGRKQWNTEWTRKFRGSAMATDLTMLNDLRVRVIEPLSELDDKLKSADGDVKAMTTAVYELLVRLQCEEQMLELASNNKDEYRQIYAKIIELFDKLVPVSYTHLTLPTNSLV